MRPSSDTPSPDSLRSKKIPREAQGTGTQLPDNPDFRGFNPKRWKKLNPVDAG